MSNLFIDRGEAIKTLLYKSEEPGSSSYQNGLLSALWTIMDLPIYAKVTCYDTKRSEWLTGIGMVEPPEFHRKHRCKNCGGYAPVLYENRKPVEWLSDYCPYCGARMEGGSNGSFGSKEEDSD